MELHHTVIRTFQCCVLDEIQKIRNYNYTRNKCLCYYTQSHLFICFFKLLPKLEQVLPCVALRFPIAIFSSSHSIQIYIIFLDDTSLLSKKICTVVKAQIATNSKNESQKVRECDNCTVNMCRFCLLHKY